MRKPDASLPAYPPCVHRLLQPPSGQLRTHKPRHGSQLVVMRTPALAAGGIPEIPAADHLPCLPDPRILAPRADFPRIRPRVNPQHGTGDRRRHVHRPAVHTHREGRVAQQPHQFSQSRPVQQIDGIFRKTQRFPTLQPSRHDHRLSGHLPAENLGLPHCQTLPFSTAERMKHRTPAPPPDSARPHDRPSAPPRLHRETTAPLPGCHSSRPTSAPRSPMRPARSAAIPENRAPVPPLLSAASHSANAQTSPIRPHPGIPHAETRPRHRYQDFPRAAVRIRD